MSTSAFYRNLIQLTIVGLGFAAFLSMNSFSLWGFAAFPEHAFGEGSEAYWGAPLCLSNALTFFIYYALIRRYPSFGKRAPFTEAVLLVAAGAIFLLGFFLMDFPPFLVCASATIGAGTTSCFFCWECVLAQSEAVEAKKQIIAGSSLSLIPFVLFFAFDETTILLPVASLAFCNFVLLYTALKRGKIWRGDEDDRAQNESHPSCDSKETSSQSALLPLCWKSLLCITMIGIVSSVLGPANFSDPLGFEENCMVVLAANLASAITLGVVWLLMKKPTTITGVYTVLFPLLITAFLIYPFVSDQYHIFIFFIASFVFTLFSITMMMACISLAKAYSAQLLYVYALFGGVTYASRLLGEIVAGLIGQSALPQETQALTTVFVLLYGCSIAMFALTRKKGGASPSEPTDSVDYLHQASQQLAKEHGLSGRQSEILDLLVHGYDVPSIAKKLFISENTVRTHTKKIYLLLDVHSKQEIIDAVNERSAVSQNPASVSHPKQ